MERNPLSAAEQPMTELQCKVAELENMREEFNLQRAKLKDMYIQKEQEVEIARNEKRQMEKEFCAMREELLKKSQQMQLMEQILQDTIDQTSRDASEELKKSESRCKELEVQLKSRQATSSPDLSLAPSAMVQALTRQIIKKIKADDGFQGNLEDSLHKAQEEAANLRVFVEPLEQQITVLKAKIKELEAVNARSHPGQCSKESANCDMCANYEAQLVAQQADYKKMHEKLVQQEMALKRAIEEIQSTAALRQETLSSWRSCQEESQLMVASLQAHLLELQSKLHHTETEAKKSLAEMLDALTKLTVDRETLQDRLDSIQSEIFRLQGKYSETEQALRLEEINLPNTVPELQEYVLRLKEELIIAVMGRERAQESVQSLDLLQRQTNEQNEDLKIENVQLRDKLESLQSENEEYKELESQTKSNTRELKQVTEQKRVLEEQMAELRSRMYTLQQDLDNSEHVQQDFVKLSQSLQVQLERIRGSDVEVRWQHDEDVTDCCSCHTTFPNAKSKIHCRHCGRIFCSSCLSHRVKCGPNAREARVCVVCHTLLVKDTAPYFSTEVPHTPD